MSDIPDRLDDVVVDDADPLQALELTIQNVRALLVRAIVEVANRHAFLMAGDTALKQAFWERAEAETGFTRQRMLKES